MEMAAGGRDPSCHHLAMSESIAANRAHWNATAQHWVAPGRRSWSTDEVTWGTFAVPEEEVQVLPDLSGAEVIEIGCGTGYVSAWLARRGAATVIGIDPTEGQLATARRFQTEFGPTFPLVQAAGEHVPFRDASFDLAVSEYGAAIWADPYVWIPEAARLLRRDGALVFLTNSLMHILCAPDEDAPAGRTLEREQNGLHRVTYTGDPSIEFHLPHGEMIGLLRRSGFEILGLAKLYAPAGAQDATLLGSDAEFTFMTAEWAQRWPAEEIWRARKR